MNGSRERRRKRGMRRPKWILEDYWPDLQKLARKRGYAIETIIGFAVMDYVTMSRLNGDLPFESHTRTEPKTQTLTSRANPNVR